MTTTIDLPRLSKPTIPGLVKTQADCQQAMIADLKKQGLDLSAANASDPALRIVSVLALREATLRQAIYDSVLETTLAYASGVNLDHIGQTYYAVKRKDKETDDAYRTRLGAAYEGLAVGLSGGWYEHNAKAVAGVRDARLRSPTPGAVTIAILADEALTDTDKAGKKTIRYPKGIPTDALIKSVQAKVTSAYVRQQTDKVTTEACTNLDYSVKAVLTLYAEPDTATAIKQAQDALKVLADSRRRLGETISQSVIADAVINAGVRDAVITLRPVTAVDKDDKPTAYGQAVATLTASNTQALRAVELEVSSA